MCNNLKGIKNLDYSSKNTGTKEEHDNSASLVENLIAHATKNNYFIDQICKVAASIKRIIFLNKMNKGIFQNLQRKINMCLLCKKLLSKRNK